MRNRIFIGAVALTLLLAGCGKDDEPTTAAKGTTTTVPKLAVDSREIAPFGKVLTDAAGHTLYFFDKDAPTKPKSACAGMCATNWPPLLASDGSGVGAGLDASMLSQSARDDGGQQYTYNGWPLYRFNGDTAAGQTNGQGVGGVWHIAGADGNPVMTAATTTAAPAARTATTAAKRTPATSPPATSPPPTEAPHPATTATTAYYSPY